jgi:hypothetical protein
MCCKLLGIKELDKPAMTWCTHCAPGVGCKIYDSRPAECAGFYCDYLTRKELDERWYPAHSKMVVVYREKARSLTVYADPDRRGSWRREPYYSQIKRWAGVLYPQRGQVVIWEGHEVIAVMPNRDKKLGVAAPDHVVTVFEKMTPQGKIYDAVLMHKDAPAMSAIPTLEG